MPKNKEKEKDFDDFSGEMHIETDFNLEEEYKPPPLAPQGNYIGNTTGVTFDQSNQALVWETVLVDNGGVMSDGETPVDGQKFYYRNWLPRPGDKEIMTASGRSTKRQAKINMGTPKAVQDAIEAGDWVGLDVLVSLGISEYQGRVRNEITKMVAR